MTGLPGLQRLGEVVLDHVVDLALVVGGRRVVAVRPGEEVGGRVEAPVARLETVDDLLVIPVDPALAEDGADLGRLDVAPGQQGGLYAVARLHLGKDEREKLGPEVHVAPHRRPARIGQRREFLGGAHHWLVLAVGVHAGGRLGAVRRARARVQGDRRLPARGHVPHAVGPVTPVLKGPASSDGEGGEDVETDQAHAGHGHRGSCRSAPVEALDGIGLQVVHAPVGPALVVPGVPRGQHHVVDGEGGAVVEQHRLAPLKRRLDVDGRRAVPDDLEVGRGVGHQRVVEPDQVLAHQPPGQVIGGQDGVTPGADTALVTHPAVAADHRPWMQAHGVGGEGVPVGGDVQGELSAGVVEHQEVRLLGGVDPASELSGLDQVQPHRRPYPPGPAHRPLHDTQTPRAEPHDGHLDHPTRPIHATFSAYVVTNDMCPCYRKQPTRGSGMCIPVMHLSASVHTIRR